MPAYAWWRIDVHIDWLLGAQEALGQRIAGPFPNEDGPIEGTQRDFYVVIASGDVAVPVEARAHDGWKPDQLRAKLRRLATAGLMRQGAPHARSGLRHFPAIMSLKDPRALAESVPEAEPWLAPSGRLPWLELRIAGGTFLRPQRCTPDGTESREGKHWRVVEEKAAGRARGDRRRGPPTGAAG